MAVQFNRFLPFCLGDHGTPPAAVLAGSEQTGTPAGGRDDRLLNEVTGAARGVLRCAKGRGGAGQR